jgi:hypothetical protein
MAVDGDSLRLRGEAVVDGVFGRAIPGWAHRTVRASVAAVAAQGPVASTAPASSSGAPEALTPLRCGEP